MDPRRVVEQIRFFLQQNDQTQTEGLRETATQYALCCADANDRLRRVQEFIVQGLRTEAIHLAEADPPLLDFVALLDFPERFDWEQTCLANNLGPLPPLLLTVAEDLNAAYAAEQPLQDLLRRHRRLALERAPIRTRLAVLRQIAELDPDTTFWADDVRDFEQARLRELDEDVRRAIADGQEAPLRSLLEELRSANWQSPPHPENARRIQGALQRATRSEAERKLNALAPQLLQALQTMNLLEARRLRGEYDQLVAQANLPGNHPLHDQVQPVMDWLTQADVQDQAQHQWHEAIRRLDAALANPEMLDVGALQRLHEGVLQCGCGIPEPLSQRFAARTNEIGSAERRKRVASMLGGGTIVAALAVVIGVFVVSQLRAQPVNAAIANLERRVNDGDLAEARALLDSMKSEHPEFEANARFVEVEDRLKKTEKDEEARATSFESRYASVSEDVKAGRRPPTEEVSQLKALARTKDEKSRCEEIERNVARVGQSVKEKKNKEYVAVVMEVGDKVKQAEERIAVGDFDGTGPLHEEADRRLRKLRSDEELVTEDNTAKAAALEPRLAKVSEKLQLARKEQSLETGLNSAVAGIIQNLAPTGIDVYARLLEGFAKSHPSSSRTPGLSKAAGEAKHWKAVLEWNKLMVQASGFERLESVAAVNREASCKQFLDANPKFPENAPVRTYQRIAARVQLRSSPAPGGSSSGTSRPRDVLSGFFRAGSVFDVWMLQSKDGDRHYMMKKPNFGGNAGTTLPCVEDFEGSTKPRYLKSIDFTAGAMEAPQSPIAKEAVRLLRLGTEAEWDDTMIKILQSVAKNTLLDPVLKIRMLKVVVDQGSLASVPLEEALAPHRAALARSGVDTSVPWMKPDDKRLARAQSAAKEFLKSEFPPVDKLEDSLKAAKARLKDDFALRFELAGWLRRDADNGFICQADDRRLSALGAATLCVLSAADDGTMKFLNVGRVDGDKATIDSQAGPAALVEGRLVFARMIKSTK